MESTIESPASILSGETLEQYLTRKSITPLLSIEEEQSLLQTIREEIADSSKAKERLIQAHQNYVIAVAERYKPVEMELSELVEAGNVGLTQSIDDFDGARYDRFYQHALLRIRWFIVQAIARKAKSQNH